MCRDPGNTTDVTTLGTPAKSFGVRRVCLVADAGMNRKMIAAVEARGWFYSRGTVTHQGSARLVSDTGARRGRTSAPRPDGASSQGGHSPRHTIEGDREGARQATSLCGVPQSRTKPARMRPRVSKSSPRSRVMRSGGPKRGRQQGLQALRPRKAPRQGPRRTAIRRHVGVADHEECRRHYATSNCGWSNRIRTACSSPIFHKTDATICGHVFCSPAGCATSSFAAWTTPALGRAT